MRTASVTVGPADEVSSETPACVLAEAKQEEAVDFVRTTLFELAKCAEFHELKFLNYLIEMAFLEADSLLKSSVEGSMQSDNKKILRLTQKR